jgi:RNA polymerase sigma-54 factor
MAVSIRLGQKQSQKLVLTQSLRQSIEMLQLSTIELAEMISTELLENPVLEEDNRAHLPSRDIEDKEVVSRINQRLTGDDSIYQRVEEQRLKYVDSSDRGYSSIIDDDDRKRKYIENSVLQEETLKDHLLWQARLIAQSEKELNMLERVITSIDDNGLLTTSIDELAKINDISEENVRKAVAIISNFDPIGCALPTVQECLVMQAQYYYEDDGVLKEILVNHFEDLEKLNYEKISRSLSLSLSEIVQKSKLIQNLDPFPGRQYSTKGVRYIIPDIEVKYVDSEIIVNLNDDWIPGIGINSFYVNLLRKKDIEKDLKEYIQGKMQSARNLIRNISSRRDTIIRVVRAIMEHQRNFLIKGPGHLKPLTHLDIADEVGLHESTVSRVTSSKFLQTNWGVFELKYFFVSRLKSYNSSDHSSNEVMNLIKDIIMNEDPAKSLSDGEILKRLQDSGINLARRTIAKYRGLLHIPSSNKRKKLNMIKQRG